jgi:hypothetical protein
MLVQERAAREEADRLRYGGLEEAPEWRMRSPVRRQDLAQGEEGRESPAQDQYVRYADSDVRTCW